MNYNEEKSLKKLQETKTKIREREEEILNSQIKQNKLEKKVRRLETKKEKRTNGKKGMFKTITSRIIYNLIMISVLIVFVTQFVRIFEVAISLQKWIYIIAIYVGVTSISVLGAIVSTKIEESINKYLNNKKIIKIKKIIHDKEKEIELEINKQEILKKEITEIMNSLDRKKQTKSQEKNNLMDLNKIGTNSFQKKEKIIKRIKKI